MLPADQRHQIATIRRQRYFCAVWHTLCNTFSQTFQRPIAAHGHSQFHYSTTRKAETMKTSWNRVHLAATVALMLIPSMALAQKSAGGVTGEARLHPGTWRHLSSNSINYTTDQNYYYGNYNNAAPVMSTESAPAELAQAPDDQRRFSYEPSQQSYSQQGYSQQAGSYVDNCGCSTAVSNAANLTPPQPPIPPRSSSANQSNGQRSAQANRNSSSQPTPTAAGNDSAASNAARSGNGANDGNGGNITSTARPQADIGMQPRSLQQQRR